ncbi:MAG TPA: hypothetical protein VFV93_01035 [Thermomicrobiales bacterium]|nr:hypothetical protein [Thermomicrobiales bacterium]
MNARNADEQARIVVQDFTSADDAIRAIQGLKSVGFAERDIDVVAHDDALEQSIRDQAFPDEPEGPLSALASAMRSLTQRLIHRGVTTERALEYSGKVEAGHILVAVTAGSRAAMARDVMREGLAYTGHMHATERRHPYLDSSTGSGAGVATSLGTATGITPGSGYEGNTGSTAESSAGVLGQYAPGADTNNPNDDFPGHEAHVEGDWRGMTASEANALDYRAMMGDGDGETPLQDVAPEGSVDAIETGIFNTGSGSTGNPILDMSIGGTAGITPSIDSLIGQEEGEGYTDPEDDDEEEG